MQNKKIRMILTAILFLNCAVVHSETAAQSKTAIRDFGYFKKIYYKDAEFLFNESKSPEKNFNIYQGQMVTSVTIWPNKIVTDTIIPGNLLPQIGSKKTNPKVKHHILKTFELNKPVQITYYSVANTVYNYSSMPSGETSLGAETEKCSKKPSWGFSELAEISKVLGAEDRKNFDSISVNKFVDENTCKETSPDVQVMKLQIDELFKNNANKMFACLQTSVAQKNLEKNPKLLENANMFVARMTRFLDVRKLKKFDTELGNKLNRILADEKTETINPMQIVCAPNQILGDKKLACFNDDDINPQIIIDPKKIKRIAGTNNIDPAELKKILLHEFYHSGNQQPETPNNPNCIDEAIVQNLESLCEQKTNLDTARDAKKCEVAKKIDKREEAHTDGGAASNATVASAFSDQMPNLNSPSSTAKGLREVNSDISTVSSVQLASNKKIGDKVAVSNGNANFDSSMARLYKNFVQSNINLPVTLARAFATSATTAAVAQTSSASNRSQSPTQTINSVSAVSSSMAEPLKNQFDSSQKISAADQLSNPNIGSTSEIKNSGTSDIKSKLVATGPDSRTAEINSNLDNINQLQQTNDRNIASTDSARAIRNITSTKTINSVVKISDNRILQALSISPKISGQTYIDIKKMYQSDEFKKSLEFRGILIQINDIKKTQIGSLQKIKIRFIDDGKTLTKIEDK